MRGNVVILQVTTGGMKKIGFEVIPTDENTKWPEEPKYDYEKYITPIESVIEQMKKTGDQVA